jgi:hypothetical protein
LLLPPLGVIIIAGWMVFWLWTAAYIFSVGTIGPNPDLPIIATVNWTYQTRYAFLYSLFGFLWVSAFIIGCT